MCDPSYTKGREVFAWKLIDMLIHPPDAEGKPCLAGSLAEAMAFASIVAEISRYLATLRIKQHIEGEPTDIEEMEHLVRTEISRKMFKEMQKTAAQIELHGRRN